MILGGSRERISKHLLQYESVLPSRPNKIGKNTEEQVGGYAGPTQAGNCWINTEQDGPEQLNRDDNTGPHVKEDKSRMDGNG